MILVNCNQSCCYSLVFFKYLNTDYIKSSQLRLVSDQKKLIIFLQFLVFSRGLDFQIEYLASTAYRQVVFQVNDFLTFQNPTVKSTNYYQLKKLLNYFEEL